MMRRAHAFAVCMGLAALLCQPAQLRSADAGSMSIAIVYLSKDYEDPVRTSLVDPADAEYGWQGARFGVQEINANGRFLGRQYELTRSTVAPAEDVKGAAQTALRAGHTLIVADLEAKDLLAVADLPEAKDAVILDARTSDDSLRQGDCRDNIFHLLPNWAMRADALGQYLARKGWKRWLLVSGPKAEDRGYAAAVKRAAQRFGAQIVAQKSFAPAQDAVQGPLQSQISALTQVTGDYDVVFAADTSGSFGDYIPYNTAAPRPVVGTQGLAAVAWDPQLQEYAARGVELRFFKAASRQMNERDYGNWLATSVIGEAVTRGNATTAAAIKSYLLSDQFAVAANRGEGLTFRRWDHQLRQPLLLFGPRLTVSMAPQNDPHRSQPQTDALGFDQQESQCHNVQQRS